MSRPPRSPRRATHAVRARLAAGAALAATTALAVTGCAGGAIGQSTAASNGKSFVAGSYQTTVYPNGSGPVSPDVKGTTLTGRKLALAAYRGDVVVLNFWGSWCGPCRQEAPALAALARHFRPRGDHSGGVRFLGVDIRDSPSAAGAFQRNFQISYPSLNDPGDEIALAFQSTVPPAGIPTTLVIGRTGRVAARIVGQVSYSALSKLITEVSAETV